MPFGYCALHALQIVRWPLKSKELRAELKIFLGDHRFIKFVDLCNAGRLLWWQERAWESFVAALPEFACSHEELVETLRICSLHGDDLRKDQVSVVDGCADYTMPYCEARRRHFPYANSGPLFGQGRSIDQVSLEVWYCPQCRLDEVQWNTRNGQTIIPLEWLQYPFDPQDINAECEKQFESFGVPIEVVRKKWNTENRTGWLGKWNAFVMKAESGDQFWTFKSAPETWYSLSGTTGFAIVRNGQCIATLVTSRS